MIEARAPQYLQNPDAQQGTIPDTPGLPVIGLRDALHATMSPELTRVDIIQRAESALGLQVAEMLISRAGRVDPDGTPWTSTQSLLDPEKVTRGAVMKLTDDGKGAYNYAEYTFSTAFLAPDAAVQFNKLTAQIEETKRLATERGMHTGRRDIARERLAAMLEKQRQELVANGVRARFGSSGDDPPTKDHPETAPLSGEGLFVTVSTLSAAVVGGSEPTRSKQKRTLATGAAVIAASAFLSACGGAVPKPPDATPRVTTYPTATVIRPTEAPPTATFTAVPPSPTATIEASPTVRPRPTPDVKAQTVLTGTIAEKRRTLESDRTGAGSKLLKILDAEIAKGLYSDLSVFDFQPLEISNPDGTKQMMYQATINKDPDEAAIKAGNPRRAGTRVVADFDYEPKNGKYIVDIDGQSLTLSTLKPAQMSGLKPSEIKIDFNFGAGEIEARGPDGQLLMTAKINFDRAGNKGPDWKAVIDFLPPTPVVAGGIFTGTPSALGTPGSGESTATPGATGTSEPQATAKPPIEATATATATRIAETVKPTGAYKEANGSIVWTSFENARDTITPPVIPGLKAQLKGETVVYVDATGKEVGEFNPEVTFTENGAVKRLGAVLFDRDSQKLKDAIGNKMPFPFPLDVRVRLKNVTGTKDYKITLYGCDGDISEKNFYAGQTEDMAFVTTSLGFTAFKKTSSTVGALAYAQLGFPTQNESRWNPDSISPNQLKRIQTLCDIPIDASARAFEGIGAADLKGYNAFSRYVDLVGGAVVRNDLIPFATIDGKLIGSR